MDKPIVVRVSKTEFELSDGQIFPHFAELEDIPTVEAFPALYDHWGSVLSNESNGSPSGKEGGRA
jgi:hypothetical protein